MCSVLSFCGVVFGLRAYLISGLAQLARCLGSLSSRLQLPDISPFRSGGRQRNIPPFLRAPLPSLCLPLNRGFAGSLHIGCADFPPGTRI